MWSAGNCCPCPACRRCSAWAGWSAKSGSPCAPTGWRHWGWARTRSTRSCCARITVPGGRAACRRRAIDTRARQRRQRAGAGRDAHRIARRPLDAARRYRGPARWRRRGAHAGQAGRPGGGGLRRVPRQGSSDTRVAQGVEHALEQLRRQHADVDIQLVSSSVAYTLASYDAAIMTLVEGAALTVLVVFLFLRSWRATLVAAIALPLSILPAFAVMAWFGYTLNSITLLALTLVIGILVDDAIVEIENIERHLDMGKRPYRAALDASDAIGFAVVAITATIVAVFLPVSFIGGFVGQYFAPFGVTVSAAVLASLLVARLVTRSWRRTCSPKPPAGQRQEAGHATGLLGRYLRMLDWALRHRRKPGAGRRLPGRVAGAGAAAAVGLHARQRSQPEPGRRVLSAGHATVPDGRQARRDGGAAAPAARSARRLHHGGRRGRVRRDRRRQRAIADPAGAGRPARTQPEGVRACRAAATGRVPRHALCLPRRQRGARRVDHPGRRGCRRPVAGRACAGTRHARAAGPRQRAGQGTAAAPNC